jgi:hypothetical protein
MLIFHIIGFQNLGVECRDPHDITPGVHSKLEHEDRIKPSIYG